MIRLVTFCTYSLQKSVLTSTSSSFVLRPSSSSLVLNRQIFLERKVDNRFDGANFTSIVSAIEQRQPKTLGRSRCARVYGNWEQFRCLEMLYAGYDTYFTDFWMILLPISLLFWLSRACQWSSNLELVKSRKKHPRMRCNLSFYENCSYSLSRPASSMRCQAFKNRYFGRLQKFEKDCSFLQRILKEQAAAREKWNLQSCKSVFQSYFFYNWKLESFLICVDKAESYALIAQLERVD